MQPSRATLEYVASIPNLRLAHINARQNKTKYRTVREFEQDADANLQALHDDLMNGTYRTSRYLHMDIVDRGKTRRISKLPYFPDRIVHWAIMQQIECDFRRKFASCSHAAIAGKGIHSALYQTRHALLTDADGTKYCLKIDVSKYFPHIRHDILKEQVGKFVTEEGLRRLVFEVIDSADGDVGVPIGNYLSQFFANLYLSDFDSWVKSSLRVKHYVRYMDDMLFFGTSPEELRRVFREVEWYLRRNLYLEVKPNWQIFPVSVRGVDFVGYRVRSNCVILRKRTWLNLQRKCRHLRRVAMTFGELTLSERSSLGAYMGWVIHCTPRVRQRIFETQFKPILQRCGLPIPKRLKRYYYHDSETKHQLRSPRTRGC